MVVVTVISWVLLLVNILLLLDVRRSLQKPDAADHQPTDYQEEGESVPVGGISGIGNGQQAEEVDYVELCGLSKVDRPIERTVYEVEKRLSELAQENEIIAQICKNRKAYPAAGPPAYLWHFII
ncbi:MAG: hypothetical protein J6C84_09920 [Lachnospiraceae bacterium]|nr:hypothetical protein [Lachnospiraceae bacterium]